MDKRLIKIAAKAAESVYKKNHSVLSTQFWLSETIFEFDKIQVLSFAGTKPTSIPDWIWNILLLSKHGVKLTAWISANRVLNSPEFNEWRDCLLPLLVTGHSKGGPPALEVQRRFFSTYCIVFCPPPCYRRPVPSLSNTLIVTDADDIVPYLGSLSFQHPICSQFKIPKNRKWWNLIGRIKDHPMASIRKELKKIID